MTDKRDHVVLTRIPRKVYRPKELATQSINRDGVIYSYNKDYVTLTPNATDKYDYHINIPNAIIRRMAKALIASGYIKL